MHKLQMSPGPMDYNAPRSLGICIVFASTGGIALVPTMKPGTLDISIEDILGVFGPEGFTFIHTDGRVEEFHWATLYNYRMTPLFLQWLQGQQLLNPFAKGE